MNEGVAKSDGTRILSLDGGDIRCLSQLITLQEFMHRAGTDAGKLIRPCEFFHSMTGVGAGGVIAILLGVLGMTLDDATAAFAHMALALFSTEEDRIEERSSKLEELTKEILKARGISETSRFRDVILQDSTCKVSICYMSAINLGRCRILRSYASRHAAYNPTIIEAVRIAWATPGKFSPVQAGLGLMQEELVSAVNGASNPTFEAIKEANETFGADSRISCLLSLGAGKLNTSSVNMSNILEQTAHDTEATAGELQTYLGKLGVYFRFSVERGLESERVEPGSITAHTSSYLQDAVTSQRLDDCIAASARISGVTLSQLLYAQNKKQKLDHGLPPLSAFFITRKEPMEFISKALLDIGDMNDQRIVVISALGGSGKTQLAIKFARDNEEKYDHIFFLDASSAESLRNGLISRVKSLDPRYNPTSLEEARLLLAHAKGSISRNWLLILDSADDPNVVLHDVFPPCNYGCILITTRNPTLGNLAPESHLMLDVMQPSEAVDVLLSTALGTRAHRSEEDIQSATAIVERLGYLPLAVVQAGCYIKMQKCLHNYLLLLDLNRERLLRDPAVAQRDILKYDHSIYAAFDVTLHAISSRALQVLSILSFLHFSHFPRGLITLAASCSFSTERFDLVDRGSEFTESIDLLKEIFFSEEKQNEELLDQILLELQQYSLVTLVVIHNVVTLRFHPVLHAWALDRLDSHDRRRFRAAAIRLVMCGTRANDSDLWEFVVPHITRFLVEPDQLHLNDLAASTMVIYSSDHNSSQLVTTWASISQKVKAIHGESHIRSTTASLELAGARWERGDWYAGEWLARRVVDVRQEILGPLHPSTVDSMAYLARGLRRAGRIEEAEGLYDVILAHRQNVANASTDDNAEESYELALCFMSSRKLAKAKILLEKVLSIRRSSRGGAHKATTQAMYSLADCYDQLGALSDAEALRQEALEARTTIHGTQHRRTLAAMTLLAESYCQQGKLTSAEKLYKKVVQLRRKSLLAGNPEGETLDAMTSLAEVLQMQQKHVEAESLWREVLILGRERSQPLLQEDILHALNSLAEVLYHQAQLGESELIWKSLLQKSRAGQGKFYEESLTATCWLAISLTKQGRHAEAEYYWRETVSAQIFGPQSGPRRLPVGSSSPRQATPSLIPLTLSGKVVASPISSRNKRSPTQLTPKSTRAGPGPNTDAHQGILGSAPEQQYSRSHATSYNTLLPPSVPHTNPLSTDFHPQASSTLPSHVFAGSYSASASDPFNASPPTTVTFYSAAASPTYYGPAFPRNPSSSHNEILAFPEPPSVSNQMAMSVERTSDPLWESNKFGRWSVQPNPATRQANDLYSRSPTGGLRDCCTGILLELAEGGLKEETAHPKGKIILKTTLGGRRMLLRSVGNQELNDALPGLAQCLSVLGKHAEAEQVWRQVTNTKRHNLGPRHHDTLYAASQQATAVEMQGRFAEAEGHWRSIVDLHVKFPGDNQELAVNAFCHLADLLYHRKAFAESKKLYEQILGKSAHATKPLVSQHSVHRMAEGTFHQGLYKAAEPLLKKAFDHMRKELGRSHLLTMELLYLLAESLYHQNRLEASQPLYRKIYNSRRKTLGHQHEKTLHVLQRQASILVAQKNYSAAELPLQELYEVYGRTAGLSSPATLEALSLLAKVAQELKRGNQAETFYEQLLKLRLEALGRRHADTLHTLHLLAELYIRKEQFHRALPLVQSLYQTRSTVLGSSHSETLEALALLANVSFVLNIDKAAGAHYEKLLRWKRRSLGDEHEDTLHAIHQLADVRLRQKHYTTAEFLLKELLRARRNSLGDEHTSTLQTAVTLAEILEEQHRYAEADVAWRQARIPPPPRPILQRIHQQGELITLAVEPLIKVYHLRFPIGVLTEISDRQGRCFMRGFSSSDLIWTTSAVIIPMT